MVETSVGMFEIIKDPKGIFCIADFEKRYVDLFKAYEFIVGDYSSELLKLKGFNREDANKIPDYINEFCGYDENYYILRNPSFDPNYNKEGEEND